MDEVVDGVFIGSLVEASDVDLLTQHRIGAVVSIGCTPDQFEGIDYCSFPEPLDMPESNLLGIFPVTTAFIAAHVNSKINVLVHCVYGQSRSATTIAAYLMVYLGKSLNESLDLLKSKHDSVCINPGFLAQLDLLFRAEEFKPEFQLLSGVPPHEDKTAEVEASPGKVSCKRCRYILASACDVVLERENSQFMLERTDPFWADYRSGNSSKGLSLNKLRSEYVVTRKLSIFASQISHAVSSLKILEAKTEKKRKRSRCDDGFALRCPGCHQECGFFTPNGLLLCNLYLLADLMAFSLTAVEILAPPGAAEQEGDDEGRAETVPMSDGVDAISGGEEEESAEVMCSIALPAATEQLHKMN